MIRPFHTSRQKQNLLCHTRKTKGYSRVKNSMEEHVENREKYGMIICGTIFSFSALRHHVFHIRRKNGLGSFKIQQNMCGFQNEKKCGMIICGTMFSFSALRHHVVHIRRKNGLGSFKIQQNMRGSQNEKKCGMIICGTMFSFSV